MLRVLRSVRDTPPPRPSDHISTACTSSCPLRSAPPQESLSVTIKPRPLPTEGWASLWQWLVNAVVTPEHEILTSAGLDAVVMTWTLQIGVSLFLPMAVVGCAIRERLGARGGLLGGGPAGMRGAGGTVFLATPPCRPHPR